MTDIHTQRAFTGYIATLLFLFASSAIAGLNIGGNVIWHDAANGARIEILGPHPDLDIPAIIYNITDASETKPYLIKLGAGIYDLESDMLRMKEWVSIQGSGQEATKLTRTGRYAVIGADNVALTDLTVEITGNADVTGISNNNVSPRIERVHVIASSNGGSRGVYIFSSHTIMNNVTASASGVGTENIGVNIQDSSPILTNVTASASGATKNYGLHISGSPVLTNITASASGGTYSSGVKFLWSSASKTMMNIIASASDGAYNRGIEIVNSGPPLTNITASASGGTHNSGVYINGSSSILTNITASASGGTYNLGVEIVGSSSPFIKDSILEGDTVGLYIGPFSSSDVRVVNSKIIGGVTSNVAHPDEKKVCRGNYDENLADVDCWN